MSVVDKRLSASRDPSVLHGHRAAVIFLDLLGINVPGGKRETPLTERLDLVLTDSQYRHATGGLEGSRMPTT